MNMDNVNEMRRGMDELMAQVGEGRWEYMGGERVPEYVVCEVVRHTDGTYGFRPAGIGKLVRFNAARVAELGFEGCLDTLRAAGLAAVAADFHDRIQRMIIKEAASFPSPYPVVAPAPRHKLWPSMAERVDAVDWMLAEKKGAELDQGYSNKGTRIQTLLSSLGFPEITLNVQPDTFDTFRRSGYGDVVIMQTLYGWSPKPANRYNRLSFSNYEPTVDIVRRILEAVREWSVTDAEGGAK